MTVYCGVDFHARLQTVSFLDTSDGELHQQDLHHQQDDIRAFYSQFSGEVIVGLEASAYSRWFEQMLEELGHQVLIGDAAEIRRLARRRQKNDHRDADLILELLHKGDFPRVHRPSAQSLEVLRQLRYRHRLVKMRTMVKNSLHAIALGAGLSLQSKIGTAKSRQRLQALALPPGLAAQRDEWLNLLEALDTKIATAEQWLTAAAASNEQVVRLQTHPGIGLITSLALAHILEPVARFPTARKVVAYAGLDPVEHSSAEKKRYGSISKEGCRFLRFLLVETAQKAVGGDQELRAFYYRLLQRKERAKARVAVARKVLTRSYIMLRDRIDYAEFLRRGVEARSARCVA
jgi:transposase